MPIISGASKIFEMLKYEMNKSMATELLNCTDVPCMEYRKRMTITVRRSRNPYRHIDCTEKLRHATIWLLDAGMGKQDTNLLVKMVSFKQEPFYLTVTSRDRLLKKGCPTRLVMVGKHNCHRRPKDIDVNFNVLVARTGKETGTHLSRDEPELCGLVAAKAPTIEKQGYDYASLKLLAELYEALAQTEIQLDREGRQRARILNKIAKIYLKTDGWKALTSGKVVRVTEDLDHLRGEIAELQKSVAETKDRQVQRAVATASKLTDTHLSATLEELGEIFRGLGKGVRIPNDQIKNIVRQLSKQGIMAPEETSLVSKSLSSTKSDSSTPAQIAQIVAPAVITRQDGNVKARYKLISLNKRPSEGASVEEKKEPPKPEVPAKPKEAKVAEPPESAPKKKQLSAKKPAGGSRKSGSSTSSSSKSASQKRSLERVGSMLGIKSAEKAAKTSAQDLQFQPAKTGDEKNDQFLIVLNLLEDVEIKKRPFSGLELKFVRDVIENETTVPLDKVQLALNEAADQKLITPAQANKAFTDVSREVIKGTANVPLTAVRKLFDGIMPKK